MFRTSHTAALTALALGIGTLFSNTASADPSPALDRISVWLGGYYADADAHLSADIPSQNLSTGRVKIGDGRETLPRARIDVLVADSQGFSFDYYGFNRSRSTGLATNVNIDGQDYNVNALARGSIDLDIGNAAYRWWFGSGSDVFGIGLGAAYYRVRSGLSVTAEVTGQPTFSASARYDDDAWAPLVTLGWRHAFSDSLRVYADASGVKKNNGNLSGHIYNAAVGVEWFPWHGVGIGAEYAATRVRLDREAHSYNANLDLDLNGPSLFMRFRY